MKRKTIITGITICLLIFFTGRILAQDFSSSNLPIIVIDTEGQWIPDEPKINVHMGIIWNGEGEMNYLSDSFNDYNGKIGIEKRGSSSQYYYPKKQYAVETRKSDGSNNNVSLLGLPEENDWILYAPYSDKTLMRNVLVYTLVQQLGWYASRCRFCELVLNDEYMGVYILMEKIKRDKNRVDISKLKPDEVSGDDLTGGYLIKIDKVCGSKNEGWYSDFPPYSGAWQQIFYQYHDPDEDEIVAEQRNYIQGKIYDFESLMNTANFNDPVNGYNTMIDIPSFVDYFLINELSKNIDGYRLSTFLYKDNDSKGGEFRAGPVWDYNLAFSNANYYDGTNPQGWLLDYFYTNSEFKRDDFQPPFWWKKLWSDPAFKEKAALRWKELRTTVFSTTAILATIDSIKVLLNEAAVRNYQRWPDVLDSYIWPNPAGYKNRDTYEKEVTWMKGKIANRIQWINEQIEQISTKVDDSRDKNPNKFLLRQNYPNPFNSETTITYNLSCTAEVKLSVYDVQGRLVKCLAQGLKEVGYNSVQWQGCDSYGRPAATGIYFYRIEASPQTIGGEKFTDIGKMLLLK